MGTKDDLASFLEKPNGINQLYLNGKLRFQDASIATKMSWMAGRTTGVIEDIAYSLLGIFNVNMPLIPNEGVQAFVRLQETIMSGNSFDESMFAWKTPPNGELACYRRVAKRKENGQVRVLTKPWPWSPSNRHWGLLAPSPDCFTAAASESVVKQHPKTKVTPRKEGGFRRTNQGVVLSLPFKDTKTLMGTDKKELNLPLNCWRSSDGANVVLQLSRASKGDPTWIREQCGQLKFDPKAKISDNMSMGIDQKLTAAVTVRQPVLEA